MTKFAQFDPAALQPAPVIAWYDTDALTYAVMPSASDLVTMTEAQWAAHFSGSWAVNASALVPYTPPPPTAAQLFAVLQGQAMAALAESDKTILRCAENAVAVPPAWASYRAALRAVVNGGNTAATALPARPAYPAGT